MHHCKKAGVRVEFCGERFQNGGDIGSKIQLLVSNSSASDYSRVLSTKVHMGQTTHIKKGFRQDLVYAGFS